MHTHVLDRKISKPAYEYKYLFRESKITLLIHLVTKDTKTFVI